MKSVCFNIINGILWLVLIVVFSACQYQIKKEPIRKSPLIKVLLDEISQKDSISFSGSYKLISEEAEYEFGVQNNKIFIVPSQNSLLIYNEFRFLEYQKTKIVKLLPSSFESKFCYAERCYYGSIYLVQTRDSLIQIINELPIEEYLRGVVPSEIYVGEQENYEAIKAQAICSRTYAINKIHDNNYENFDIFDDSRDQVYKGANTYHFISDQAVKETQGIIITYNDNPATIFYHSTCGGKLESVDNVFTIGSLKYLAGGSDAVSEIYSCSASPKFRWSETRSIEQIDSSFQKYLKKSILPDSNQISDTINIKLKLSIEKRTETGRVKTLRLSTADTTIELNDLDIRKILGKVSGTMLPSNLFYLSQENDSTISIIGGGFGHGVGMCQWGAMNMSKNGFKFYHILNKYFPGTLLSKGY